MALIFTNRFNEICKSVYPNEELCIKYITPYVVLPFTETSSKGIPNYFFEMVSFKDIHPTFCYFNHPDEECKLYDFKLA